MVQINVRNCPSCDAAHEMVECHEYHAVSSGRGNRLWSHWFTCPTTGDPISILMQIDDGKLYEVEPELLNSIVQARKTGKYIVAIFRQEPAGSGQCVTHCVQHPYDFPTDHFGTCVGLLKNAFDKVAGPPPKDVPMSRAKPEPMVNLWQPKRETAEQPASGPYIDAFPSDDEEQE